MVERKHVGCRIASCDRHINCDENYRVTSYTKQVFAAQGVNERDGSSVVLVKQYGHVRVATSKPNLYKNELPQISNTKNVN